MSQEKGKANRMVGIGNSGRLVKNSIKAPRKTKPTKENPNKPQN